MSLFKNFPRLLHFLIYNICKPRSLYSKKKRGGDAENSGNAVKTQDAINFYLQENLKIQNTDNEREHPFSQLGKLAP